MLQRLQALERMRTMCQVRGAVVSCIQPGLAIAHVQHVLCFMFLADVLRWLILDRTV
jgi:hypothetical protein